MNQPVSARVIVTALGCWTAAANNEALVFLQCCPRQVSCREVPEDSLLLDRLEYELSEYVQGKRTAFDLPLFFAGTEIQSRVWNTLQSIPYGETQTLTEFSTLTGISPEETAEALAQTPLTVLLPSHRVTGYQTKDPHVTNALRKLEAMKR